MQSLDAEHYTTIALRLRSDCSLQSTGDLSSVAESQNVNENCPAAAAAPAVVLFPVRG